MTSNLEVRDVRKSYGKFKAVDGVSFAVPETGTIFGLLGPNGAGKTTTIRMIMDIIAPDSGEVHLFGRKRGAAELRRVGYLPEERGLYPKMTVIDQLLFLGEIHGRKRRDLVPAIDRWLDRVDLAQWKKSKVEELSKGMQQKVQLIGTVLHKPDLLILDEPFSGLDPINQELFRELLESYRREGKSVVLSTHGMELAERMCDHICLISKGRAVLQGELRQIKREVGGNAYRLVADGDLERLRQMPEVETMAANNGVVKLMLKPDASGSETLRRMVEFLQVHEFRSEEPELEQIFMKAVRDAA
jgi:ABC-2 type transport system ATP-binding protein